MQIDHMDGPPDGAVYIFNHVAKAGGTSLFRFFGGVFGESSVFRHRARNMKTNEYSKAIDELTEAERSELRFVGGHFGYGKHALFDREYYYLAVVRDPEERFVSNFYFNREKGRPDVREQYLKYDINDFLRERYEEKPNFMKGIQIRQVTGESDLATALKKIDEEFLVAFETNQLNDAQKMLADFFNCPYVAPVHNNRRDADNSQGPTGLTDESRQLIADICGDDRVFVQEIAKRFDTARHRFYENSQAQ